MAANDLLAPVSLCQERLWFLDRLVPDSAAYNVPTILPIEAPIDAGRVRAALQRLVDRHGALRTSFTEVDGVPMQRIATHLVVDLPVTDLRRIRQDERQAELHAVCRREASLPFKLDTTPLVRARLVHLTETSRVLLLTLHHICADAWSLGILLRDFASIFAAGEEADLPPLPLTYADFARWQRQHLRGALHDKLMAYWRERLHGAPAVLPLPFDRPRPPAQTFAGALRSFEVPAAVAAGLRRLAARNSATPFMALLAAFDILLARYSGSTDIVIGIPIANRSRPELESLVGFVANTLALRTRWSGDPTFSEVLAQVRDTTLSAYEHQDMPFEKLVAELQPARARDHSPIFQVLFALQNTPTLASVARNAGEQARIDTDSLFSSAKFDLSLLMGETVTGFIGSFEYSTDLFDDATIQGMLSSFQVLLRSIVAEPARPISQLALLDASRRRDLLASSSPAACSEPACIHDLVRARSRIAPGATALRAGTTALTYAELEARADAMARALLALGVGRGMRVGVLMSRTPSALVAVLAILKTGAAFVPLDSNLPAARLTQIATDAGVACILREPGAGASLGALRTRLIDCTDALWREPASGAPPVGEPTTPDDIAYAIYTSGSTGSPKGIAMPHGPFCNMIAGALRDSRLSAPTTLQFAAWGFDVFLQEVLSTWTAGGTLVLASEEARRDPAVLLRFLRREGIARLYLPPVALHQLAEAATTQPVPTPELKEIVAAGETLRITPALRRWLSALPGCRLVNQYGPAESHVVTEHWLDASPAEWPMLPPIGKPLPGTTVLLLDASMNLVPDGVPGEIHIGRQIARGYLNRAELDEQRFVSAPFAPKLRLYRTGDQARRRHDGTIEFLGRLDRQVKIRGYRVEPAEIDAVLATHLSVKAAATLAPRDETDAPRLVSYIVPNGDAFDSAELRRFLAARLAEYMIPAVFVLVERLPVTENGKLDPAALPSPTPSRDALDVPYVKPRNDAEAALAAMWKDLLRVTPIGIRDDFFALGGHSLLAVRLVSRIRDHFGVDLSVAVVFDTPTIAGLAERIFEQQLALESGADIEQLIAHVESMSEAEALRALDM